MARICGEVRDCDWKTMEKKPRPKVWGKDMRARRVVDVQRGKQDCPRLSTAMKPWIKFFPFFFFFQSFMSSPVSCNSANFSCNCQREMHRSPKLAACWEVLSIMS